MQFVPMKQLLEKAQAKGYAVPAFCIWNAETMQTVLDTAARLNAPVILMSGPGEFPLLNPTVMGAVGKAVSGRYAVKAAFHLDHGDSLAQVRECLDAGYSSVMLDFSTKSFEENANALRQVVAWARPLGVTVEGELGAVGKVDQITKEGGHAPALTDPDEAAAYVKTTGVDTLAVAIGNAHGIYTKLPELDFDRLAKIHKKVAVPLVLHGGSGTPDDALRKAIALGVAKVNVASELIRAIRESLLDQWQAKQNLWTPGALAVAAHAAAPVVEKWICRLGADGQAG